MKAGIRTVRKSPSMIPLRRGDGVQAPDAGIVRVVKVKKVAPARADLGNVCFSRSWKSAAFT